MSQNVIELNGKRYDAITGAYLGKGSHVGLHMSGPGRVIDGFMRPQSKAVPERPAAVSVHHKTIEPLHPPVARKRTHQPAKLAKPHHPEHAKTLKRTAVHQPSVTIKPKVKTQAPAELAARPHTALQHKPSASSIDPDRSSRATHISRHQAVRHFHSAQHAAPTHSALHVPVIPVRAAPPAPARAQAHKTHSDIFESAIARAKSHEQPRHTPRAHRTRRRLVNSLAIVAAFLVIGGFVGYLNLPNLELRVASVQAGFRASMPSYTPTGYALQGDIKRSGGTVSLSFRSGDSRYTITQQASDWNSQTLLDNTLALTNSHDTIQKNGQTIYVYGNGANAAWVNGGVRYDLAGNAQLSSDDIAQIATSL